MNHPVIGVVGASGGLGASTLAVALAVRAARSLGVSVCADNGRGGGVDVTACAEHVPGLRWGDLASAAGRLDGTLVLRELPVHARVRLLAAHGEQPPDEVRTAAITALSGTVGLTALDLGRVDDALLPLCDEVLLLAGSTARHLADAVAMAGHLAGDAPPVRLVLRRSRRSGVDPEEVAFHLDLPLAGVLVDDDRVRLDEDRAQVPGVGSRTAVARLADSLLGEVALTPALAEVGA